MRQAAAWVAVAPLFISLLASADVAVVLPAKGVGEPAPDPSVVLKVGELLTGSLRRAGLSEPVGAQDPAAQRVELARGLYFDLKFDQALQNAEAALARYREHPDELGDGSKLVSAHVYAAMALLQLNKKKDSDQHLLDALIIRPDLQLSDAEFPPNAISALDRVRQSLASKSRATLTISTSPPFSALQIDGKKVGDSPFTAEGLLEGDHFVQVSKDGFKPKSQWVHVAAPSVSLPLTLTENPAERLRAELATGIAAGGGDELSAKASELAKALDVSSVVVVAVSRHKDRFLVSAARVPANGKPTRAYATVAADLFDAATLLDKLAAAIAAPSDAPVLIGSAVEPPPDFAHHFLGVAPPPPAVANLVPKEEPVKVAPVEEKPLWKKPWVWIIAGGAVAAAGGGAYLLTRPAPQQPGVGVTVEFPQ